MELKPGYKRTEVGVIPEEWEIRSLEDLSDKISVGIASAATHAYQAQGVPFIRNQNLKPGALDDEDLLYVSHEFDEAFKAKRLRAGDLLTARTGYPGVTCVVPAAYDGAQSFTTLITRPKSGLVDSGYLCCFVNSEVGEKFFEQSQIGGAQKNVNAGTLRRMLVPTPAMQEQRAIATALSDVDALLTQLDRLIAKKRDIKQAAMQQLLTGKTRLPGFDGEWKAKRLGDLGEFLKGSGVTRDQSDSGDLPCVRYGEIYTSHNDVVRAFQSFISHSVAATALRLRKSDILFAGSGETKEEIGKCVAFVDDFEAYAGGDIVVLRPRSADAVFIGYALNAPAVAKQKASRGQGDAVVHISAAALADIEVALPEVAEQTAIATLLSDLDAELAALDARRAKTRALKQGMMQELLTGRTRLI